MLWIDPKAVVTAVGLLAAALGGGQPTGYGLEVVLLYDGERLELGVDPRVVVEMPLAGHLTGITLANVTLVTPTRIAGLEPELVPYLARLRQRIEAYEAGHWPWWQRFGIMYPLEIMRKPFAYDPCSPLYTTVELGCRPRRLEDAAIKAPRHSLFRFTLAP